MIRTAPVIRFRKVDASGHAYWTRLYEIHVNGKRVGYVGTQTVTFDRKPAGFRVVTSRTRSDRWFAGPEPYRYDRTWRTTRKEAGRRLVEAWNREQPAALRWSFAAIGDAAHDARDYRKGEV